MSDSDHDRAETLETRGDRSGIHFFAACLVSLAASWYLLNEWAVLFRPLFLAVLLAYVMLPIHFRVRRHVGEPYTTIVLAVFTAAVLLGLAELITANARHLQDELPRLTARGHQLFHEAREFFEGSFPWVKRMFPEPKTDAGVQEQVNSLATAVLSHAASTLGEALVVALYLTFLLVEAGRFPQRVQKTFPHERAKGIQETITAINTSISSYLGAKVKSSFLLAGPVTLILLIFGVKFAGLWGLLTFMFNFVPYIGSVLGCGLPVIFAFLDLASPGTALAVAILLLSCHIGSASFVEPYLLGKAVGLPPIVILMALTFWGLCWGIGGMLLAVPLTVMLKIIMEHVEATRSVALLLSND